jgi:hypothetical protein
VHRIAAKLARVHNTSGNPSKAGTMALRNRADASAAARHMKSCPGVNFGRSMATVGELLTLWPKSWKYSTWYQAYRVPSVNTGGEKFDL